jgi:hypothetical protein
LSSYVQGAIQEIFRAVAAKDAARDLIARRVKASSDIEADKFEYGHWGGLPAGMYASALIPFSQVLNTQGYAQTK